ncbi:MAG: putative bifunctional diguanylate cyclase/phosphodiesterase [Thiobacillus sp.]
MKLTASFTINQIALAFMISMLIIVSLIGTFSIRQTNRVTLDLTRHSQEAAQSELSAAFNRLLLQTESQANALAQWDETRQQLVLPEFYTYWRDHRVYESSMQIGHSAHAGLYNQAGALLAPSPATHNFPVTLPSWAEQNQRTNWIANEGGIIYLYHAFPVESGGPQHALLGYGLIRFDFMAELLRQERFHFTDVSSVKVNLEPGEKLATQDLISHMQFKARPDPDQHQFQSILSNTLLALFIILAITSLLAFVVYNRLLQRPLKWLSDDIEAMQNGHFRQKPRQSQRMRVIELEKIHRSLYDYQLQLNKLHGSLESQNREFHSQARQDALTGCHNRRAYEEDWESFRSEIKSAPQGSAFLLFDCDRFKTINDTYGHAKGDRVLTLTADALKMALRANDRLYRLGGDEFGTFMSHTSPAQAKQIAHRCQNLVDAIGFGDLGILEPISISIGIAFSDADQVAHVDDLPKQADIAMYTAKQPGRSRVALYGEDTKRDSPTLVASRETSALFQALVAPGMIEMHYQPIHALPGRQVAYFEALARIRHNNELLLPEQYLPVVSSRRLEVEFDQAVLHQVGMDLSSGLYPEGLGVSINLSAQSIAHPDVMSHLMELSSHLHSHPLTLEITETSLITQMLEVRNHLDVLRSVHFKIAMDDFGTGYSPLQYLVDLPVDVVKLDISLIQTLAQDNRAGQIVAHFARMMSEVGYALVAEGVETEAVLYKVENLGITHVQGFLLGRPTPLAQLSALLPAPPLAISAG